MAYRTIDKQDRVTQLDALRTDAMELVCEVDGISEEDIRDGFKKLEKKIVRGRITRGEPRIDGRDSKTVRAINVETSLLS